MGSSHPHTNLMCYGIIPHCIDFVLGKTSTWGEDNPQVFRGKGVWCVCVGGGGVAARYDRPYSPMYVSITGPHITYSTLCLQFYRFNHGKSCLIFSDQTSALQQGRLITNTLNH